MAIDLGNHLQGYDQMRFKIWNYVYLINNCELQIPDTGAIV